MHRFSKTLRFFAAALLLMAATACQEEPEPLPRETLDVLASLEQSLNGIESSISRIESQHDAIRKQQQTAVGDLEALRVQAETVRTDLDTLEFSTSSTRKEIDQLRQMVVALRGEMEMAMDGVPIPAVPSREANTLETALAIAGFMILVAAIAASLLWVKLRKDRGNRSRSRAFSPAEDKMQPEEPSLEERTDLGTIHVFGAARTEYEKQQGVPETSPQESAAAEEPADGPEESR